jgi:hypothetical protein
MKLPLIVFSSLLVFCLYVPSEGTTPPDQASVDARAAFPPSVARVGGRSLPSLKRLRVETRLTPPVPGGLGAGTIYREGALRVTSRAELYTKMIVHPNGIDVPNWLFTTATNRTEKTVEVVAIYIGSSASLGVFDWSCSPDFPCPNGATEPSWQWTRDIVGLGCYYAAADDGGGHLHDLLTYVNRSSKRGGDAVPAHVPNWRNAVLLLNQCTGEWDMVYRHDFRADQKDCSVGQDCAWWGPIIETFNDDPQPAVPELGFVGSTLRYDNSQSQLGPDDTEWSMPWTPWIVFHLDPNRSWGVGSFTAH